MSENLKRFFLLLGLMLYIFDLVSDILVADKHWNDDETWWFGLTVVFICFPSIIVNFAAIIQIMDTWTCTTAFAQLSIVARYVELSNRRTERRRVFPHLLTRNTSLCRDNR